ncbi:hypothetical protein CUJ84_Chr000729 [Rhizobium leguminosarum]|uniref:Uncharacterized protein n=1 Tax=Rhizobium leguminosarum TaxID=384 RepID=A0A2K9YYS4_RHILE|nr:hypothetical protein CUJ84_Chr000729 [Rhizobium leguminosarum]
MMSRFISTSKTVNVLRRSTGQNIQTQYETWLPSIDMIWLTLNGTFWFLGNALCIARDRGLKT